MGRAKWEEDSFINEGSNKPTGPAKPGYVNKRGTRRFRLSGYEAALRKAGLLSLIKRNLAQNIQDLSQTGAKVQVIEEVPVGTVLTLEVTLAKFKETVKVESKVQWSKRISGLFVIGLKFQNVSTSDRAKLQRLETFFTDPRVGLGT